MVNAHSYYPGLLWEATNGAEKYGKCASSEKKITRKKQLCSRDEHRLKKIPTLHWDNRTVPWGKDPIHQRVQLIKRQTFENREPKLRTMLQWSPVWKQLPKEVFPQVQLPRHTETTAAVLEVVRLHLHRQNLMALSTWCSLQSEWDVPIVSGIWTPSPQVMVLLGEV